MKPPFSYGFSVPCDFQLQPSQSNATNMGKLWISQRPHHGRFTRELSRKKCCAHIFLTRSIVYGNRRLCVCIYIYIYVDMHTLCFQSSIDTAFTPHYFGTEFDCNRCPIHSLRFFRTLSGNLLWTSLSKLTFKQLKLSSLEAQSR